MMVVGVGVLLFHVPFRGSLLLLTVLSAAFILGALGLGVVISALARSQLLATQMALMITFLPTFLLSGFMFAIDVMPLPLQAITYLIPARYFLVVTRGIFLKGVGLEAMAVEALLMVAFAVLGVWAASRIFRKEVV
jgi:drug efflux transport system permease protein